MKKNVISIVYFIGLIWIGFFLSFIIPINNFGIIPRTLRGLIGIILSPFLHANLNHILSNTTALIVFTPLFSFIETKQIISKLGILILVSGFITWTIGGSGVHIGASGLIFSLYGFLISLAYFQRKFSYFALSFFISIFYGYMIFGVFPIEKGISWEGHLGGLIAGIIYAKYLKK
ncbi:MAG: rhomboid family intramembrane serine protease [Halobacteriovoraceae bacterium]|nr:rhomboid family intramembrane serine protease [Halobacteriovoraceae bacterium]